MREARGHLRSFNIGCRLEWLLPWLKWNPQLSELYYTKLLSEGSEVDEFWDELETHQLTNLMLDGFDFPSVTRFPVGLVELILTHLDDVIGATNKILAHLPNLRLLSLRSQRNLVQIEDTVPKCGSGENIACRGLRKIWWTLSTAPEGIVPVVAQTCTMLQSLSPPRNVTDQDLISMSQAKTSLTEIWMMDCPKITQIGFDALKSLGHLRDLQIQIRFASFLTQDLFTDFVTHSKTLNKLTIVFDGAKSETVRRAELYRTITGTDEYHKLLSKAISFQPSNIGDKIIINIQNLR